MTLAQYRAAMDRVRTKPIFYLSGLSFTAKECQVLGATELVEVDTGWQISPLGPETMRVLIPIDMIVAIGEAA